MNPSRPPRDAHRTLVEWSDRGRAFAVAIVLAAEGSTPRKAGTKAIVDPDGTIHGTVGGGRVEAEVQRRAPDAIRSRRVVVFDFDLLGEAPSGGEPICGGRMRLLIDPAATRHRDAYAAAASARDRRERGLLVTTIRGQAAQDVAVEFHGSQAIPPGQEFPGAEALEAVLAAEEARHFVSEAGQPHEQVEVLVEPLVPRPVLLIAGGGHIGQALAAQASLVGFDITVIDDRAEFTRPELFPEGTGTRCGDVGEEIARLPFDADTYAVIVTRDHAHDAEALAACLGRPSAYVGMIGSRRKVTLMRQDFIKSGRATAAALDCVYAPIGLDIGSRTVPEIAASIVAQLIAVRRTGHAPRIPLG